LIATKFFRGHKARLYEGGIRTPDIAIGRENNRQVSKVNRHLPFGTYFHFAELAKESSLRKKPME